MSARANASIEGGRQRRFEEMRGLDTRRRREVQDVEFGLGGLGDEYSGELARVQ